MLCIKKIDEIEFIESIDACFPYADEQQLRSLIKLGAQISDNTAYMVLNEICSAPNEVSPEIQLQMLSEWENSFDHPVKGLVVESGRAIINGTNIPVQKAIKYLNKISKFKGNYNALSIVYFSCDDSEGQVDDVYNQIIKMWEHA
jgi:hypothetical protein